MGPDACSCEDVGSACNHDILAADFFVIVVLFCSWKDFGREH